MNEFQKSAYTTPSQGFCCTASHNPTRSTGHTNWTMVGAASLGLLLYTAVAACVHRAVVRLQARAPDLARTTNDLAALEPLELAQLLHITARNEAVCERVASGIWQLDGADAALDMAIQLQWSEVVKALLTHSLASDVTTFTDTTKCTQLPTRSSVSALLSSACCWLRQDRTRRVAAHLPSPRHRMRTKRNLSLVPLDSRECCNWHRPLMGTRTVARFVHSAKVIAARRLKVRATSRWVQVGQSRAAGAFSAWCP